MNARKKYYIKEYNDAEAHKESILAIMQSTPEKTDALLQLQNDYENENLSELLKNTTERVQMETTDKKIIRRFQPVFMEGKENSFVRAPFFASQKRVFGNYYNTYNVNTGVIWFMTLFLGIALYFESLKKLISVIENIFANRKRRKDEA